MFTRACAHKMPPKKNGKRKNGNGKTKAVAKAVRKVAAKTEFKDRVSINNAVNNITTNAGSPANGPANSLVLVPKSFMNAMTQGPLNGQFDGNEITPKYLNMKVKFNFEHLDPFGKNPGGNPPDFPHLPQSYYIQCIQGWVKITLKEAGYLSQVHSNVSSGKHQPAFNTGIDPHTLAETVAKRALYQANFNPEFLTYERKDYGDVKVLRRFRVYGDMRKKFVTPMGNALSTDFNIAPDKHYSFNWKMMGKKQTMAPITNAVSTYGNAETWIPFTLITFDSDLELTATTKLAIEHADHYTYSDL